ncbi:LysR family transcriptional regulator [Sphingomonas sp. S-NIH.Pt1_0416]|uniref:LysR family transcriptional regulator n=1 Tax=Sphingomonas sp. S-NIH.Pt1_0416 TaxID=1920123 RepID=UPI000F7F0CA8|nr:LysR family transcriptional regulator [Sphingomonas sp. S-NIH.Pt1_0416]RSU64000.1 LysR family transcriptional regulator [Sphingomonas sp. S-NIH.Pt1_0416]
MAANVDDLTAFVAVAKARGFREAGRALGVSPTTLSETVRRLEDRLGVRLLHRTTRSVSPTEAGGRLVEQLAPLLTQVDAALASLNVLRDTPTGTLRLNVPVGVARLVLPSLLPEFLALYPDIQVEVVAEDTIVDVLAAGADAGIRYDEKLEQDMIAVPIGPRVQRFAMAAAPDYLAAAGVPEHPRDLLLHRCLLGRFGNGALFSPWELECGDETVRIEPKGPLTVSISGAMDLAVDVAIAGVGIVGLFEEWLRPHIEAGRLIPVLPEWWTPFPGPFLYYSGRRLVPPPLRAFLDFIRSARET